MYHTFFEVYGPQDWWPADTPFEVTIGAVLTQNTAWSNVEKAIDRLKERGLLDPEHIRATDSGEVAEAIRPAGYFNVKAERLRHLCSFWMEQGGYAGLDRLRTDELRQRFLQVHGVGPETADDILLYAFDRPVFVIDAYTRRIGGRLRLLDRNAPYETLRHQFETILPKDTAIFKEYHALLVEHAKQVCTKKPKCSTCVLASRCPEALKVS
ncbi:MAG TPA: endonuclease III domain-containing protein [Chromatiales bacterium]|nr:endonuclease III domain-containing protein [Chromatiales bacterium]